MLRNIVESPYFREGVFIFAVILLLGGFKIGVEASVD